jgi:putative transposase
MTWAPTHLTREQMETRRRAGAKLLRAGRLSQAEIARQLGVSRATVSDWAKRLAAGGLRALKRCKAPGRPTRLTVTQQRALIRQLKRGALAAGFPTDRWTLRRIGQVIERMFGVHYHVNSLHRLLDRLDWSLQQPLPRAAERDEELIRAWLAQDWPRIKKSAAVRRGHRVL